MQQAFKTASNTLLLMTLPIGFVAAFLTLLRPPRAKAPARPK